MSYNAREEQRLRDEVFGNLQNEKARLEVAIANWMDKGTALHSDSPLQTDKDEIVALRDALVAKIRVSLGV